MKDNNGETLKECLKTRTITPPSLPIETEIGRQTENEQNQSYFDPIQPPAPFRGDGRRFHTRILNDGYEVYSKGEHWGVCLEEKRAEIIADALELFYKNEVLTLLSQTMVQLWRLEEKIDSYFQKGGNDGKVKLVVADSPKTGETSLKKSLNDLAEAVKVGNVRQEDEYVWRRGPLFPAD